MFLGAILAALPIVGFEVDEFYNFIEEIPEGNIIGFYSYFDL